MHIGIETRVCTGRILQARGSHWCTTTRTLRGALTFRLPAPADFNGLYGPHARNATSWCGFVEYDMPASGAGEQITESIRPTPREPFYGAFTGRTAQSDAPLRFADRDVPSLLEPAFRCSSRRGLQQHAEMLHDARVLEGNSDDWGGPSRSMAGIGGGTKETAAKSPPYGYHDDRGEPAAMEAQAAS